MLEKGKLIPVDENKVNLYQHHNCHRKFVVFRIDFLADCKMWHWTEEEGKYVMTMHLIMVPLCPLKYLIASTNAFQELRSPAHAN